MNPRRIAHCTALLIALHAAAMAAGIEGVYTHGTSGGTAVKISRGKDEGAFAGVLIGTDEKSLKKLVGLVVLELHETPGGPLRGRCNACFVRLSPDVAQWLDVAKAVPLDNGDLRLTLQLDAAATVQIVLSRQKAATPGPGAGVLPAAEPGELAGAWKDAHGAVTHFVRYKERYVGQLVELSTVLRAHGFHKTEERFRLRRTKPGVYTGTLKLRSFGGKKQRWDDVELTVEGDRLTYAVLRDGKPSGTRHTAARLVSSGGTSDVPGLVAGRDDGDLTGLWRETTGGMIRYARKDKNDYTGTIIRISPASKGYGFTVGQDGVRLKRTGRHTYIGTVLVHTYAGRTKSWDAIDLTVHKHTLKFIRHMRNGGTERGSAVRIGE